MVERRDSKRFEFEWEARVRVRAGGENGREIPVRLGNVSSTGVYIFTDEAVDIGVEIEVGIRVPFRRESWLRYEAEVIRVDRGAGTVGVAARFLTAVPGFAGVGS